MYIYKEYISSYIVGQRNQLKSNKNNEYSIAYNKYKSLIDYVFPEE